MRLTPTEIDLLYPKICLKEYEDKIRTGLQIAEKSSVLVYTNTTTPDLELIQDLTEVFQASALTFVEPTTQQYDYLLKLDRSVVYVNVDGILNTLGWLEELNAVTLYGTLRNRRNEIVNYGNFETEFNGDRIDWHVGNLPMEVDVWSPHLSVSRACLGNTYLNPSLVGLL